MILKENLKYFEARRKAFINYLPDYSLVVIPNKPISIRSNDVEYKYKPNSDFYYLTGLDEPNSICILKKEKKSFQFILLVEPKDKNREIWTGKKIGLERAKSIFKADLSFPVLNFETTFRELTKDIEFLYFTFGVDKELDLKVINIFNELKTSNRTTIKSPKSISDSRDIIHKMRLIKDKYEIACMEKAAEISKNAHILAMTYAREGSYEYELEAILEYRFRHNGSNGPAYPSIVGSGNNCTILHYIENNKKIKKNDLILIDAGCEYDYYASDLTRTFPENKKFTSAQKDIYSIVLEAQLKAIQEVKPGKTLNHCHDKALSVIVDGLKSIGLLKGTKDKIIKNGEYKKFFMHKIGHWLGLDVHDAGPYYDEKGNPLKLSSGMVLTIEPGIYISDDLLDVPEMYRGIGIRIEDDVLVTKKGHKVLTQGTPKTINEIELLSSSGV